VYPNRENPLERPGLAQKAGRQPQQWSRIGFRKYGEIFELAG
jgi:hypothetical protein